MATGFFYCGCFLLRDDLLLSQHHDMSLVYLQISLQGLFFGSFFVFFGNRRSGKTWRFS
ncbi:MAG: hypothetical protein JXA42_09695 [Anaerolineales bacterium]|nr:hypothetical protein [Anaerolineales bacterium]